MHPELPERGGIALAELFGARMASLEPILDRLRRLMAAEGLRYREPDLVFDTRRAQELRTVFKGRC